MCIKLWRDTWHTLRRRGHCHPVYTAQQLLCPPDLGEHGFDLETDCPGSVEVSYSVGLHQGFKAPVRTVMVADIPPQKGRPPPPKILDPVTLLEHAP